MADLSSDCFVLQFILYIGLLYIVVLYIYMPGDIINSQVIGFFIFGIHFLLQSEKATSWSVSFIIVNIFSLNKNCIMWQARGRQPTCCVKT